MKRRTITVFYDNTSYTQTWLRALVFAKKEFEEKGFLIKVKGFSAYIPKMGRFIHNLVTKDQYISEFSKENYDIVMLAYHHSNPEGLATMSSSDRAEVLEILQGRCNILVWLDTSDSTGTCLFDVMPYVDAYLKKQVLINTERYYDRIWGGRPHCDYYHIKYKVDDEIVCNRIFPVLDKKYTNKMGVSWNVGLGDLFTRERINKLRYRKTYAPFIFTAPSINRELDAHYRGSTSPCIALWQRNKTMELVLQRNDLKIPDVTKKVPYSDYVKEIKNSRTIISPFGWGEVCTRDFEAFMYGAMLIKMDMSHMKTYPDIYIKDKTYMSIDWDFSNFNEVIDYILTERGKKEVFEIAQNGQAMYKKYLTTKAKKEEFAEHILRQIKSCR